MELLDHAPRRTHPLAAALLFPVYLVLMTCGFFAFCAMWIYADFSTWLEKSSEPDLPLTDEEINQKVADMWTTPLPK